ncbi:hypothetical protein MPSEU_000030600 [Mayamaea pseudoterrestris]|nr:hypothetical protein MPSEU_000030600 [Mayamaea pseudoterrestris]
MMSEDPSLSASDMISDERSLAPYDEILESPIVTMSDLLIPLENDDEEMSMATSPIFSQTSPVFTSSSSVNHARRPTESYFVPPPSGVDMEVYTSGHVAASRDDDKMESATTTVLAPKVSCPTKSLTWTVIGSIFLCCIVPVIIVIGVFVHSMRAANAEQDDTSWLGTSNPIATGNEEGLSLSGQGD